MTAATYMHIKREELGRQFLNQDRYVDTPHLGQSVDEIGGVLFGPT